MSAAEHTPGPWIWNKGRPGFYDLDWLTGANDERVFTIYGNGQMTPNKLLVAAAPDLLRELEQAQQDTCSLHCPSVWKTSDPQPHSDRCKAVQAAIAKAKGAAQ